MKQSETDRKYATILGIKVDSTPKERLLTYINEKVEKKTKFSLFTPNPEIILAATRDKELKDILNKSDFNVPDGVGLKLASPGLAIIHGRKLMIDLFSLAQEKKLKVFFITSNLLNTKEKLLSKVKLEYPNINAQAAIGPKVDLDGNCISQVDIKLQSDIVSKINNLKPDLLFVFVCFGQSKQEKWIAKWLPKLNVTGAIGVGGALDYYAETKPTPPTWMEKLELEWLWRMFTERGHIKRVWSAVIVFPLVLLGNQFKK
jgi:N-acetylglucosaminyldiphosphoundecaprenol N-acetyl-beta-D-mannosaminyltransferase